MIHRDMLWKTTGCGWFQKMIHSQSFVSPMPPLGKELKRNTVSSSFPATMLLLLVIVQRGSWLPETWLNRFGGSLAGLEFAFLTSIFPTSSHPPVWEMMEPVGAVKEKRAIGAQWADPYQTAQNTFLPRKKVIELSWVPCLLCHKPPPTYFLNSSFPIIRIMLAKC